jgi:histidyl-tRNA synthetase
MMENLRARGLADFANIDVRIVRGLAYYTGVVFEVFDRAGKFRAIAGGGRYDQLVSQLSDGAASLPAIGFAVGDVVMGEMIRANAMTRAQMEQTIARDPAIQIFAVIAKPERREEALQIIQKLRDHGWRVDYPLSAMNIPKQFHIAENRGARFAIVFGDEWPQIAVKDLASTEQVLVPREQLIEHISQSVSS